MSAVKAHLRQGGITAMSRAVALARGGVERRLRFGGRRSFVDRSRGSDRMLVILAGFKQYLWPVTLERLERFPPADTDVCIVSAGVHSPELDAIAARRGWSYLATENGRISAAQNMAISLHPRAEWIFKVDEDVVVPDGLFDRLLDGYRAVEAQGDHVPGFVAPVLNVNGFSYVRFLATVGALEDYRAAFGRTTSAAAGIPVHGDGDVARWVWERSLPFDAVAARIHAAPFGYSTVPHRFSIGAILFRRRLWEEMGGFLSNLVPPGLGADEAHICMHCVDTSQVMAVLDNAFAGHWCFGPQEPTMRRAFDDLRPGLEIRPMVAA
jgi:hypothetical protein